MSTERKIENIPTHYKPNSESHDYNPVLDLMEFSHALNRLQNESLLTKKEAKEKLLNHQKEIAELAMNRIFRFSNIERKVYLIFTLLDNPDKHLPEMEFTGFQNKDGQWFLGFKNEEEPLYVPVQQLAHSEQINHVRIENVKKE